MYREISGDLGPILNNTTAFARNLQLLKAEPSLTFGFIFVAYMWMEKNLPGYCSTDLSSSIGSSLAGFTGSAPPRHIEVAPNSPDGQGLAVKRIRPAGTQDDEFGATDPRSVEGYLGCCIPRSFL